MSVFDCKRCGQCCEGRGGIVLGPRDQARLAARFGQSVEDWLARYAEKRNGKFVIRAGEDGRCVFFQDGAGCTVHQDKPDVCRAWPFFHGNMVDAVSLAMAKEFCPGIAPDATHAEFVAEGKVYLQENGLAAHDPGSEAVALLPAETKIRATEE